VTGLGFEDNNAPPAKTVASPWSGAVIGGKYRILRLLGTGGMGQVYEAENLYLKRIVAIKVVAQPGKPEALLRLEREAQLLAAIQHPNVCDVYDVGRLPNGDPYVVFERLFGAPLAEHLRSATLLPIPAVVDIFSQMLSGLQAAHNARIIHRDLKPQNVFLVDRVGCAPLVKIVDFGLARDLSTVGARITRPGNLCGTLQYMSPEQLRGEHIDHRSDLFAVGTMLYEALTGRHPFTGTSPLELQTKILRGEPRPLRSRRNEVPVELERVVAWAMAVDVNRRPSNAMELQGALRASTSGLDDDESTSSTTNPIWTPLSSIPPR
jgi:serine/threonine-protein kinase